MRSTIRASVLIVGHPNPGMIAFGADFCEQLNEARNAIHEFRYPVIAVSSDHETEIEALELLEYAGQVSPMSQKVVIQNDTSSEGLRKIINSGTVFRLLSSFDEPRFSNTIEAALGEYQLLQQNQKLLQMVNERNEQLKRLTAELEERVEARRKSLDEAKAKSLVTNRQIEALHQTLVAIHRASSIPEMERLINESLAETMGLSATKIRFRSQARTDTLTNLSSKQPGLHHVQLTLGEGRFMDNLGHIFFSRSPEKPFSREETHFLNQVADAVALASDRLNSLKKNEDMKQQWEATFDAVVDPVCLLDDDRVLVRINRSFAQRSGAEPEQLIGKKCHEALFGKSSPCEGCALPSSGAATFRLKPARTASAPQHQEATVIYDVFSQEILLQPEGRVLHVNMYHDATSQLRLERQIVESAKMAELGTIGSSIAHELNNPLGGMLSYLQLIKMDMERGKSDSSILSDIVEMEKGALRCRDIVQSLLGFTRKSTSDNLEIIDMREVLEQALKITELQTRSLGIATKLNLPEEMIYLKGQFNALAQAIRNLLQNSQEAIVEKLRQQSSQQREKGQIEITLHNEKEGISIEVRDNGAGFDASIGDQVFAPMYTTKDPALNPGLGLTVAQEILRDHGGSLEISSTPGSGTTAKISLPRAENEGASSSF